MAGVAKAIAPGKTITRTTTLTGPRHVTRTEAIYETRTFDSSSHAFVSTTVTSIVHATKGGANPNLSSSTSSSSSSSASTSTSTTSHTPHTTTSSTGTAAAASSSSSSNTGSFQRKGHSFTAGDVAGAAVGCLIGGFLIAFLVAFLLFRRRKSRKNDADNYYNNDVHNQPTPVAAGVAGGATAKEKSISPSDASTLAGWMAYLPQSADDRTIQTSVKTFFNAIELHVDNFYHRSVAPIDENTREALAQLDSGKLPGRLEELMQDSRLAIPAIKHCIADLLITRLQPLTFAETSLLPAHLAAVPPRLQSDSTNSSESLASQQAYSQWRLLNACLYPSPEKDGNYIEDREMKASEIAELLSAAFAPWQNAPASGEEDGEKSALHEHERGLVATAGNLGILLISQPAAFEFRWSAGGLGGRSASGRPLIAFPGFWKVSDEVGKPLEQPQILVEPVVLRV